MVFLIQQYKRVQPHTGNSMKSAYLWPLALILSACATKVTMVGPSYPPTDPSTVKVFATQKPDCNLEELGVIVTNLKWNQEKAVEDAKINAAKIGATHIQIGNITRNMYNDAAVSAVAFRCKL
jgi:hypothetical protein